MLQEPLGAEHSLHMFTYVYIMFTSCLHIDDIDVGRLEIVKLQPRRKFHLEGWLGVWDYLSVALTPD